MKESLTVAETARVVATPPRVVLKMPPAVVAVVAAQIVAFWPVWRWYLARVSGAGEEAWGLLALACAAYFLWRGKADSDRPDPAKPGPAKIDADAAGRELLLPALLVVLYAISYPLLPPLARAAIAVTALGCTASRLRSGRPFHPSTLGLLYLSLPLIPSLQFYGGYPLRAFVAAAVAPLLRLGGYAVSREGTSLDWAGRLIWVDAPCSGIRMLWAGLFLACVLACLYELRPLRTVQALAAAAAVIVFGNVLRAAALFYVEAGVVAAPPWAHDYVGVVSFAAVAVLILLAVRRLRRAGRRRINSRGAAADAT
ncbi:MAG TPA: archaeosortase/exosortase family protein [Pyrinomonadaceae bacterium]